jgi:hypothetical protein
MEFKFRPSRSIFRFLTLNISLVLIVYLLFLISNRSIPKVALIFGVIIATQLPTFILFIQYYINDYKTEFIFKKSENILIYNKGTKNYTYSSEQVSLIQLTARASRLRKNGIRLFLSDDFFYYKFFFTDGKSIILSSLILNGKLINEANFKNMNFQKQAKFFPFLTDNN